MLYDKNSAAEPGTLYAAKNFLNATNVPLQPMDDVDQSFEFFKQYTEALLLAAAEKVVENKNITQFDKDKAFMEMVLDAIIDDFVTPGLKWDFESQSNFYECGVCGKKYKKLNTLRKHAKDKHQLVVSPGEDETIYCKICGKVYMNAVNLQKHMRQKHKFESFKEDSTSAPSSEEDNLQRYTIVSLVLGLIVLDFNDARKMGDGERLIRLYKLILLLFKIDGRTKYSYYTYQLLCQVYYLLPEYMAHDLCYNRFVNNAGKADTNVKIDRDVEHYNKKFKLDCKDFHGKITSNSIERSSNSYQSVDEILRNFDKTAKIHSSSGQHVKLNQDEDTMKLSKQFISHRIFDIVQGRRHSTFPKYPKNIFQLVDIPELKQWMASKIKKFSELNIYRSLVGV